MKVLSILLFSMLWAYRPSSLDIHKHIGKIHKRVQANLDVQSLSSSFSSKHFQVFYSITGSNSVSLTDNNKNNIPDYIETVSSELENAWAFYIDTNHWSAPPQRKNSALYTVYIDNLSPNLYGYVQADNLASKGKQSGDNENTTKVENNAYSSFMALRNDYSEYTTPDESRQISIIHEFFHSIQFGYGADEKGWLLEGSATNMESILAPQIFDNFMFLPILFKHPYASLTFTSQNNSTLPYNLHDYASWPFYHYLYEYYGKIPTLRSIEEISSNFNSQPKDMGIDILKEVLTAQNTTLATVFAQYNMALLSWGQNLNSNIGFSKEKEWREKSFELSSSNPQIRKHLQNVFQDTLHYQGTPQIHKRDTTTPLQGFGADYFIIEASKEVSIKLQETEKKDMYASLFWIENGLTQQQHLTTSNGQLHANLNIPLDTKGYLVLFGEGSEATKFNYSISLEENLFQRTWALNRGEIRFEGNKVVSLEYKLWSVDGQLLQHVKKELPLSTTIENISGQTPVSYIQISIDGGKTFETRRFHPQF